jgi:hypothetical protein
MRSTEYLYELDLESLEKMKYFEALRYKANCAKRLYTKLEKEKVFNNSFELQERIFYVYRAWKHTEKLINEKDQR